MRYSWYHNGRYVVAAANVVSRHTVHLERPSTPELILADLTGSALKALGLNNDISAGDDYTVPMAWAKAIHEADARWEGIRCVSRQHNDRFAYALFERSDVAFARTIRLEGNALVALCDHFGVDLI